MSFFGLGDIKFNKQQNTGFGPLSALEGTDYQYNTFRYPLDVGNYDKGHYMVIYIRTQQVTKAENLENNVSAKTNIENSKKLGSQIKSAVTTGVENLFSKNLPSFSTEAVIDNSIKKITDKGPGFLRKTSRTSDAIALYMPDTMQFDYSQNYSSMSPGTEIAGQAIANSPAIVDKLKNGEFVGAGEAAVKGGAGRVGLEKIIGNYAGSATTQLGLFAATGAVLNPMLEMLYSSPEFRSFQFDFLFYPRSENEALEVQKIIERLRYHQAPDLSLNESGQNDGLLIPPSEFELSFYYGGSENPNIPQIGQCVLDKIQVNYAPNGFSAYEIPGEDKPTLGRTGMPVAIQMTLNFREITYLTKTDFRQDLPTSQYKS
jgi:hypothetical protein